MCSVHSAPVTLAQREGVATRGTGKRFERGRGGGYSVQGGRALGFCISRASGGWVRCVRHTELAHIKIMSTDVWARRNPIQPVPRLPSGSKERFVDDYLNPALPVVLEGHARDWPAFAAGTFPSG